MKRKRQANADDGRPVRANVTMTVSEGARLRSAAEAVEMSVPAFLVESALKRCGVETQSERSELLFALNRVEFQLAKIGNNLNQIARFLNATGELHGDVRGTLKEIRRQIRDVQDVAGLVADSRVRE